MYSQSQLIRDKQTFGDIKQNGNRGKKSYYGYRIIAWFVLLSILWEIRWDRENVDKYKTREMGASSRNVQRVNH